MATYEARIRWTRGPNEIFSDGRYSRAHTWAFDGGVVVPASSAVSAVPLPFSKPENVDPEEAFVAAISSCHMLTFLYLAAKARLIVDTYDDNAVGEMARNDQGRLAVTRVRLAPVIAFSGPVAPADADVARLHHDAHAECYIANSVRSEIVIAGAWKHAALEER